MNQVIFNAIKERNKLTFTYKDSEREVEPHTYGCNFKGNHVLRAFQVNGETTNTWKLFSVDKMEFIETASSFNAPREGYTQGDSAMQQIYIEI